MSLDHARERCTGNWKLVRETPTEDRVIACDECGQTHDATPEQWLAAIDENESGRRLRQLTELGEAERKEAPPWES